MRDKLREASLFFKIALVGVAGMIVVAACTLFFGIRTTERAYMKTLSISNEKVFESVKKDMEAANDLVTRMLFCMSNSNAFKSFLTSDGSNPAAYLNVYAMSSQLSVISPQDSYDVIALSADGSQWYSNNDTSLALPAKKLLQGDLVAEARREPSHIHYRFLAQGITKRSLNGTALIAFKAMMAPGSSVPYGYGFVIVRQEDLRSFYSQTSTPANRLMLVNNEEQVVSSTGSVWAEGNSIKFKNALKGSETGLVSSVMDGPQIIVQSIPFSQWNLNLVAVLDRDQALRELDGRGSMIVACTMVCVVALLAFFLILRQITHPIRALVETMNAADREHLATHVQVQGAAEARRLAEAFNSMLDDIHSYIEQVVTLNQEKRDIELQALQMQIKPHFIYNTLTSIKWLVWQKETEKAVHCIDDLTVLLRSILTDQQELVTVAEEVEALKSYVYLQQVRFGEKIRVDYYLIGDAAECRMPKFLLQPLMENAFFHAFVDRPAGGTISVFFTHKNGELICEVMDDGVGMAQETINAMLSEQRKGVSGIGLANVDRRFKLRYGEAYGVRIFSDPGCGTTVRIQFPVLMDE